MDWKFDFLKYAELEPQKYYENKDETPSACAKRDAMINNAGGLYIGTEKHDGEWAMCIIGDGIILIRSRSRGVGGNFGNFTDKVPHIVEELKKFQPGTVLLGELCYLDYKKTSKDVGSILRCLTPKAIARQQDESMKLHLEVFDCLCRDCHDMLNEGYEERYFQAKSMVYGCYGLKYIECTQQATDNFSEFAESIWSKGGEGVVIQRRDAKYAPGSRPSWQSLKVKKHLDDIEVIVTAANEPTREYTGLDPDNWSYHDANGKPVTKYWANHWAGGITVDYKGKAVSISSGLSDEDREWLTSDEASILIKSGQVVAVISAMEETEDGSLRHPIVKRIRTDAK
jgi:ATP-dependent DNA ligase